MCMTNLDVAIRKTLIDRPSRKVWAFVGSVDENGGEHELLATQERTARVETTF